MNASFDPSDERLGPLKNSTSAGRFSSTRIGGAALVTGVAAGRSHSRSAIAASTLARAQGTNRSHGRGAAGTTAGAAAGSGAGSLPPMRPSIATRASPMSRRRAFGSFVRQRSSRRRSSRGVFGGKRVQSGSRSITRARTSVTSVAVERAPAGEHLVEHAAERPDVGAPIDGLPARLLRRHVGGRAENHAQLRRRGR